VEIGTPEESISHPKYIHPNTLPNDHWKFTINSTDMISAVLGWLQLVIV